MSYFSEVGEKEFSELMAEAKVGADHDIRYWDGIYNVMAWLEGHGKHPREYAAPEEIERRLPAGSRLVTAEDRKALGGTDGCH